MSTRKLSWLERWRTFLRLWHILGVVLLESVSRLFTRRSLPESLYRMVVRLGPTFIKLAQVASTRPDLVPANISTRFKELQEHVPPFSFESAQRVIEEELGKRLADAFANFPNDPIASASLAQVYFAELSDGTPVAVKVQRPGIESLIKCDLAILSWLARLACRFNRIARDLRLEIVVKEFGRWTLKELDFEIEAHNAEEFRRNFSDWKDIVFPKIYWSYTTPRVLTMQRVSGVRVDEVPQKIGAAFGRKLARRLAEMEMKMFISDAFFHADLHPGNIFFQPNGHIAVLDLGMVGRMTPVQRDRFLAYWIAITRRQRERAFHHLIRMAESTARADLEGYRVAYDVSLDRFYDKDLSERSLAQTYLDIVVSGARYGVVFPAEMILQAKAVVTAEALDLVLAPDFRFSDEVRPIVARELAQRATPRRLLDRLWGDLAEWVLLGEPVPAGEPPTDNAPDEREFRRRAKVALLDAWVDEADRHLNSLQLRLSKYASASYWIEHPERQTILKTALSLLRLLATGLHRLQQESDSETDLTMMPPAIPSKNGRSSAHSNDATHTGWESFTNLGKHRNNGERYVGDELTQVYAHLETLVDRFADPTLWIERREDEATMRSIVTLLRFLVGQIGQTVHKSLVEHKV